MSCSSCLQVELEASYWFSRLAAPVTLDDLEVMLLVDQVLVPSESFKERINLLETMKSSLDDSQRPFKGVLDG